MLPLADDNAISKYHYNRMCFRCREREQAELEMQLGNLLSHPNVVRTVTYSAVQLNVFAAEAMTCYTGTGLHSDDSFW